jgi:hypothetical protein
MVLYYSMAINGFITQTEARQQDFFQQTQQNN